MHGHPGGRRGHHLICFTVAAACACALLFPLTAAAAPPVNDNRAAAEAIPSFPATITGTTVEATVERLDPQKSTCGSVESTVWYRIDKAPDGTVVLDVAGAGLAPVLRVYEVQRSSIEELECASAKAGGSARVSFETTRGASYLVLVGKKPATADAAFTLKASLFLPPANDNPAGAKGVGKLPATVRGSTVGATSGDADPDGCGLARGTVWFNVRPGTAERMILRLKAQGALDAAMAVVERVRSDREVIGCAATNARGAAILPVPVRKGASYQVVVGQRGSSGPGEFVLGIVRAQAREQAPGKPLAHGVVRGTVNGLTDVNDMWWVAMQPGSTYRIALSSRPCVQVHLSKKGDVLRSISCSGYATFTPGPDGGGRYVFEIVAPSALATASYTLHVVPAGVDDLGVGAEIAGLTTTRGTLAPAAADVVDLYHFDVGERSDVELRLSSGPQVELTLMTDYGSRIATGQQIQRQLDRGRYVLAVRARADAPTSPYALTLVIRRITSTTLTMRNAGEQNEVAPRVPVTLSFAITPSPGGGMVKVQIDRFDPMQGWQFARLVRVPVSAGGLTWTPPALGRWRVRAGFLGTTTFSPSRSGYVHVLVAKPLPQSL